MAPAWAQSRVQVLYAGSLVALMEHSLGLAFDRATGFHFEGYAGGSNALAQQIKGKLRPADVFISADPKVNALLMGKQNGNWLDGFVRFARSPLVIGYNPASRFAQDFRARPWLQVLEEPGLRIGRTDPRLDPKGRLTLTLLARAAVAYHQPKLVARIFGAPENPAQVLPEEELIGRLQSGQIDAGFFYSLETAEAHIPSIALPAAIAPHATYTLAILNRAPHEKAAQAFVRFLLGPKGRQILTHNGLELIQPRHQDMEGRPSRPQAGMGVHAP
ncbi:MAG: extracellular solute-binding protein [Alphaproteobacteria bacterium]|nr:extracellular solute-binding protein [Alphaproteobacteria bacterium]